MLYTDVGYSKCRMASAVLFAVATALPVLAVAWILAFSVEKVGEFYGKLRTIQKWLNIIVGILFIGVGVYYCVTMFF